MNYKHHTDCYFFKLEQDMHAQVPYCKFYKDGYNCPCHNCPNYVPESHANTIIAEFANKIHKENLI